MRRFFVKFYGIIILINLIFIFFTKEEFPRESAKIEKKVEKVEKKVEKEEKKVEEKVEEKVEKIPQEIKKEEVKIEKPKYKLKKVTYRTIKIHNLKELNEKREGNYVYSDDGIDLRKLSGVKRKNAFIKLLLPGIKVVQKEIICERENIEYLSKIKNYTPEEKKYLVNIFSKYRVKYGDFKSLKSRLIVYPTSLILTQGAIESAWGTSRFFREGNNIFGIWSSNKNEPRIKAGQSRGKFTAYLRAYPNLKDCIGDLVLTLSRLNVYEPLRRAVNRGDSPSEIARYLNKYSEQGEVYVKKVQGVLNYNKFQQYDK